MMNSDFRILKELLDDRYEKFNTLSYIDDDPIQVPHLFTRKEDIEIAAFLASSIAWGQRKTIIRNAHRLMERMDHQPYEFVMEASVNELEKLSDFVHRTFNGTDCMFFLKSLKNIYQNHGGLENVFTQGFLTENTVFSSLSYFRQIFMETPHERRSEKHLPDVNRKSSAKRLNMMLRWLVRKDTVGVDLGIWNRIPMSALMIPLDVHVGNVARGIGLTARNQNDWTTVEEITELLREMDPEDPCKYDYALFSMGLSKELNLQV